MLLIYSEIAGEMEERILESLESNWNKATEISRGAQGVVYRVPSREGEYYAVKTGASENEIERLSRLNHPNIVKFIDITTHNNRPAMVMEYFDRNLRQHLDRNRLNKDEFLEITRGIADGIAHVHALGMVHGDIKSENILLHLTIYGQCIPKIGDFGIARNVPGLLNRPLGSYRYMAPELLNPERIQAIDADAYSERERILVELEPRIDTWAFGCLVWELLTCIVPFEGCYDVSLPTMVSAGKLRIPLPHDVSVESLLNMLKRCLVIKPESRSTMIDMVEIGAEVCEEMKYLSDADWSIEQDRYLAELSKHGFKARSATGPKTFKYVKKFELLYKECCTYYFKPILKKILKELLMLFGKSERGASESVIWVSDGLYKISKSTRYRTVARAIERPFAYVLTNLPILLRDGLNSENFVGYFE